MNKTFNEIFNYVKSLEIIDTHEHLPRSEDAREKNTDVLKEYSSHYFNRDLVSAGLSEKKFQKVANNKLPIMERWDLVEPYWEAARHTGYGRALDISAKGLYGIDKISKETIEELDKAFQKSLKPGHFEKVLKKKSKIKISLLDSDLQCDKKFFRSVYRLDDYIYPVTINAIKKIEKDFGSEINSFQDWLKACENKFNQVLKLGAVALKSGLAYERTLKYEKVNKKEAEEDFNDFLKNKRSISSKKQILIIGKHFQDYTMHFILKLANERKLTFQFHTGLQSGNGNIISNSDPSLLSNLFLEYPNVDFDIFHIGYPYQHLLSALAKIFPNVYINMCWVHIISPTVSVNALVEFIDSVPINKISAFGGDYSIIDGVYGHQYLARQNVSKALAIKVDEGVISIKRAKEIAEMLFYKNPLKILKLEGKI